LSALFERYLKTDVGDGDVADDTFKTYRTNVKQYLTWCESSGLHPLEATRRDLKEYRLWLIEEQRYQRATVALKLSVVRRFYEALIESEYLVANPALGLKPPRESRDPAERLNYLQAEEMYRLLESLPDGDTVAALRDRLLVAVMVLQGCRTLEMHRVSVGDIVRRGTDVGLRVRGKRSLRVVPLTPDLAKLLSRYLSARRRSGESLLPETPLLISLAHRTQGQRLSRRSMQRIVDKYLVANGWKHPSPKKKKPQRASDTKLRSNKLSVETDAETRGGGDPKSALPPVKRAQARRRENQRPLSAHSLRHTAGTLALRAGASLRQVQDLLGHADPRTTALYAHIADRWHNNPALWLNRPAL
jgi:site-specific recombinase XerD